jgi:hypothetical protein
VRGDLRVVVPEALRGAVQARFLLHSTVQERTRRLRLSDVLREHRREHLELQ